MYGWFQTYCSTVVLFGNNLGSTVACYSSRSCFQICRMVEDFIPSRLSRFESWIFESFRTINILDTFILDFQGLLKRVLPPQARLPKVHLST